MISAFHSEADSPPFHAGAVPRARDSVDPVDIPSLGLKDRKTLVILGAGATRGASFVDPESPVPPPLDQDFFQVLQMSAAGRTDEGRKLIEHVRTVYGPALSIGLETVFNNLDAARIFHKEFKVTRGRILEEPMRLIDALRGRRRRLAQLRLRDG